MLNLVVSTPSPFFLFQKLFLVLYLDVYLVKFFFLVQLLMLPFCPPYYHFLGSFLGKGSTEKKWKSRQQRLSLSLLFYSYLKIYWFCLPASVPLMALLSHLFFLCFCLPSILFPSPLFFPFFSPSYMLLLLVQKPNSWTYNIIEVSGHNL